MGLVQAGGGPAVDDLGAVAHRGVELAQRVIVLGGQAALLLQLAARRGKGILAGLQLAGGQLPQLLLHGVAELAHHADGAVRKQRQNTGPAVVMHHLAQGRVPVLQLGVVHRQRNDPAFVDLAGIQLLFQMGHTITSFLRSVPEITGKTGRFLRAPL